jgi:hypothetical protein
LINCADWLIDMGPEGGTGGGTVIAAGPPERITNTPGGHTGDYLKPWLEDPGVLLIDLPVAGQKIARVVFHKALA